MKVLWLCNTLIDEAAKAFGGISPKPESWIQGYYNCTKKDKSIHLVYLFPGKEKEFRLNGNIFIAYPQKQIEQVEQVQVTKFVEILDEHKPDAIHIFGTEYAHTYAMLLACKKLGYLSKVVLSIQGLVSVCSRHFMGFMPSKEVHKITIRDLLRDGSLYAQRKSFLKRGELEKKSIRLSKNVIGRTDWDYTCVKSIHPNVNYYYCGEILRDSFYREKWDFSECEIHSIFVAQAYAPLKGMHLAIEALSEIVKYYPDAKLYTTGISPFSTSFTSSLKRTYYSKYLGKLIKKYSLRDNVVFLGRLDEAQMKERFLKSNVFVCCSTIENSPNSVGEAMSLGMPIIASDVGGMKSLISHRKEGILYQADAPYMLVGAIKEIFENRELANSLGNCAYERAKKLYDKEEIRQQLLSIYDRIINS